MIIIILLRFSSKDQVFIIRLNLSFKWQLYTLIGVNEKEKDFEDKTRELWNYMFALIFCDKWILWEALADEILKDKNIFLKSWIYFCKKNNLCYNDLCNCFKSLTENKIIHQSAFIISKY